MADLNKAVIIHFNSQLPISCNIRNDSVVNFVSAELSDKVKLNIDKGDPVVLGLLAEESIKAVGGSVAGANMQDDYIRTLIILTDNKDVPLEKRRAARFSTSLYGIISRNNMLVSDIYIKNISELGLCILTSVSFEIDEQVEVDMFLKEDVGKFKCKVVRKTKRYNRHEYGLTIIQDEETLLSIGNFIKSVQDYHAELMSVLKG